MNNAMSSKNTQQNNPGGEKMNVQTILNTLYDTGVTKKILVKMVYAQLDGVADFVHCNLHFAEQFVEDSCSRGYGLSVVATSFAMAPEANRLGGHVGFVWADFRYGGKSCCFRPFPQTKEHAENLLHKFPLPPSLTIHTPGLIQAFWLLRRPIVIRSEKKRMRAKILVTQVQDYFSASATEDYRQYESTCDLNHRIILSRRGTELTQPLEFASVLEARPDCRYSASEIVAACNAGHARCKENWNARFPRKSNIRGNGK